MTGYYIKRNKMSNIPTDGKMSCKASTNVLCGLKEIGGLFG
jgi:hypothetical protein